MKHNVKKFLSLLLAFSMVLSLMSVSVFANGKTTEPAASTQLTQIERGGKTYLVSQVMADSLIDQPIDGDNLWKVRVSVPEDFAVINKMIADGLMSYNTGTECQRTIIVANDIDFSGKSFTSLQGMRILLDGQNHTISNLTITGDSTKRAGLLSYGGSSEIKDLTLNNVTAKGTQVGAFIGNADGGKLTHVTLSGNVALTYESGNENWNAIGAFVGWSTGTTLTNVAIADNTLITIDATGMIEDSDRSAIPHWSSHPRYIGSNADTSVTGIVSVGQNVSYSYKPSPVAKIGVNEYFSLETAFAAAQDGDTITLMQDASGNGIIAPENKFNTRGLTVDFNGHTYTIVGPGLAGSTGTKTQAFQLLKGNKITFKDGEIIGNNTGIWLLIQNYADLTLDGMTLDATKGNNNLTYVVSNNNGDILIKDSILTAKSGQRAFDVCVTNYYPDGARVTVEGNSVITGKIEYGVWGTQPEENKTALTITGGTFNGAFDIEAALKNAALEKFTITGGKFSTDPSKYVPERVPVVKMNNMYYVGSIQAAVNEAPNDGTQTTIEILRDATDGGVGLFRTAKTGFTQATNKNLIFDFKGHTLTIGTPLVGSTGTESQSFHLEKGNTVTLENGKLYSDKAAMLIQNYCDLTLDNMEVGRATDNYSYALSNNNGDITIKDTTITASSGKVAFDVCVTNYYPDGARVTVEGNSVINGTIEYDVWGTQPAVNKTGLNIKGGTFNGSFAIEAALEAAALEKFSITGGTFSSEPNAGYVATGYKAYANGTSPETYTVKKVEVSVPTTAPKTSGEQVTGSTGDRVAEKVTYQVSDHNTAGAPAQEITVTSSAQVTVNDINVTEVLATAVAAVDSSATSVDVALSLVKDSGSVVPAAQNEEQMVIEIYPLATITTTTTGSSVSEAVEAVKLSELAKPINVTVDVTGKVSESDTYATVYHYLSDGTNEKVGTFPIVQDGSTKTVTFPAQSFSPYGFKFTNNASAFDGVLSYVFEATGEKSENNASIVDVKLGGTVSVDVYLKNAQASATENTNTVYVSAGTFTLALPSGLKYGGFVTEVGLTANLDKVANGIKFYCTQEDAIKIAAGARTKIGTLTLNVDTIENEDLFYGKALTISANEGGVAISNAVEDAEVAAATPTQVEIVTKYPIHWAGQFTDWTMDSVLTGDDVETTYVGARILPTHVNPTRTGYTFAGWDTTIVKAVAEATYTAQWTANKQEISIEQKGDFNGIVSAAVGETEGTTAKTNETVTLNVEPPTGYHVSSVVVSYTDKNGEDQLAAVTTETENSEYSFTMPGYAVTVTVTYAINAKVAFADYKYGNAKTEAPTKLVLVGVDNELLTANKVLKLGITADAEAEPTFVPMFKTTDENYLSILNSNGNDAADTYGTAYVYIVAGGTEKSNILGALKVVTDTASANKEIARNGDVNGNNAINITDVGIVDDLLYQRTSAATVQMRLEADMDTSDGETTTMGAGSDMFGSLNDIVEIIKVINNLTANTNSDN